MRSLSFGRQLRLHITFSDEYIRFIVTGKNSILKFGQKCLPEGMIRSGMIEDRQLLFSLLEQYLSENNIKKLPTFLCIPDGHTIIRKVAIPNEIPDDEVKGHLYMIAGESLHLPFEDPIIETVRTMENAGQNKYYLSLREKPLCSNIHNFWRN